MRQRQATPDLLVRGPEKARRILVAPGQHERPDRFQIVVRPQLPRQLARDVFGALQRQGDLIRARPRRAERDEPIASLAGTVCRQRWIYR